MSQQQIHQVFTAESGALGHAVVHHVMGHYINQPIDLHALMQACSEAGFGIGLEAGLAIACGDIAAGRMLLAWLASDVPEQRLGELLELRSKTANAFLAVLK